MKNRSTDSQYHLNSLVKLRRLSQGWYNVTIWVSNQKRDPSIEQKLICMPYSPKKNLSFTLVSDRRGHWEESLLVHLIFWHQCKLTVNRFCSCYIQFRRTSLLKSIVSTLIAQSIFFQFIHAASYHQIDRYTPRRDALGMFILRNRTPNFLLF